MADVETPVADSSPAPAETPQAQSPAVSIPTDPKQYREWRETGKLPGETKPSKDDSATSKKTSADEPSEKAAPAPEAGDKRQVRSNAETRKEELRREIRELLAQRDQARQEADPGKKDVKAEPSAAPEPEGLKRPVKPKQDDFDDWASYETAADKYLEDLADYKAAKRIEELEQRHRQESATREMQTRLDDAKSRYGDEAEPKIVDTAKTVFNDQKIPPAIKTALGRSDVLVDALYVIGSDPDALAGFLELAKSDPLEALRKWFTVESEVKEKLGKQPTQAKPANGATPARGADGKFLPDAKPARMPPPPPTELNGNTSPAGDERERAANQNNFRAFKQEADRRDMLRFKGSG
jgi:hypothetical protein